MKIKINHMTAEEVNFGLEYIRDHYKVPAQFNKHVEYQGKRGIVVGFSSANVKVLLELEENSRIIHPKDVDLNWLELMA